MTALQIIRIPILSFGMLNAHLIENKGRKGMERFYMGHGGPLSACEVQRHTQVLMTMK